MFKHCCKAGHRWLICPCLHALLWMVTAIFLLLLALQGLWIYGLFTTEPVPVPAGSLRWVEKQISRQLPGARIELDRLAVTADARLTAKGTRIFLEGNAEPILVGDHLALDLSLPYLILGKLHADSIHFRGVRAYCPVIHSPTGRREQVARAFSGNISMRHDGIEIHYLHGLLLDIPISAAGTWNDARPITAAGSPGTGNRATDPLLWAAAGLGQILTLRPQADWLQDPHLHVVLHQSDQQKPGFTIHANANRIPMGDQFDAARLSLEARLFWEGQWRIERPVVFHGERIEANGYGTVHDLTTVFQFPENAPVDALNLLRGRITLFAGSTGNDLVHLPSVRATARADRLSKLHFDLQGDLDGSPVYLHGDWNPLDHSARAHLNLRDFPLRHHQKLAALLAESTPEDLELPTSLRVQATITLAPGFQPSRVEFDVGLEEIQFNGQDIHRVEAHGAYLAGERHLSLNRFHATFPSGSLQGTLDYNLEEADMVLGVQSEGMHPDDLTPILPEWWEEVFQDFAFHDRLPTADFSIRKKFGMHHTLYFFGSAEAWDTEFRGLRLDHGTSLVIGRPGFVEVYNLNAIRDTRETTGSISWVFDPAIGGLKSMNWSISSGIPPGDAKTIFSEDIQSIFDDFVVSGESSIASTGRTFNARRVPELKSEDRLHLSGETSHPLTYLGYPLDHLAFDADFREDLLQVKLRSVGIAGGEATGQFHTLLQEDNRDLEFDIHLRRAQRDRLTSLAALFMADKKAVEPISENPEPATTPPASDALIDLQIAASGPRDNPLAFSGSGSFELRDPNLARIRLLGLLSNILEQTPLPFGTLAVNRMVSDFTLEGPIIQFPNMRITGPVTRIRARGDYSLQSHDLDFGVQVFLGNPDESAFLSIITSVLHPITYALELNLSGPLENPSWSFAYGPGSLFSNNRNSRPSQAAEDSTPGLPTPDHSDSDAGQSPAESHATPTTSP